MAYSPSFPWKSGVFASFVSWFFLLAERLAVCLYHSCLIGTGWVVSWEAVAQLCRTQAEFSNPGHHITALGVGGLSKLERVFQKTSVPQTKNGLLCYRPKHNFRGSASFCERMDFQWFCFLHLVAEHFWLCDKICLIFKSTNSNWSYPSADFSLKPFPGGILFLQTLHSSKFTELKSEDSSSVPGSEYSII